MTFARLLQKNSSFLLSSFPCRVGLSIKTIKTQKSRASGQTLLEYFLRGIIGGHNQPPAAEKVPISPFFGISYDFFCK